MFRRLRKPKALASLVAGLTRPLFGRRGLADGTVAREWPSIAGPLLAAHTIPERIVYPHGKRNEGTLHLRVDTGGLATDIQHLEPQLIERINGYFGYRAVARLKLTQGPVVKRDEPPKSRSPLNRDQEEVLSGMLAQVDDADLQAALDALGRSILARENSE